MEPNTYKEAGVRRLFGELGAPNNAKIQYTNQRTVYYAGKLSEPTLLSKEPSLHQASAPHHILELKRHFNTGVPVDCYCGYAKEINTVFVYRADR